MRKRNKNIVLENIKLVSAGSKGVAVGKTAEGKTQKRKSAGCAIGMYGWFGKLDNGIHQFVMPFAWG